MRNLILAAIFATSSQGFMTQIAKSPHGMPTQTEIESSLLSWAHANELKLDLPVHTAFCEDTLCRGLVASRSIKKDEVVVSIPKQLLMNLDTAFLCPLVQAVWDFAKSDGVGLSERQVLVLHLIIENRKGSSSFWYPFIRSMPNEYDTLENWEEATVAHLQLPTLIRMAAARRAAIRNEHQQLQRALAGASSKLQSSAESPLPRELQAGSAPRPLQSLPSGIPDRGFGSIAVPIGDSAPSPVQSVPARHAPRIALPPSS